MLISTPEGATASTDSAATATSPSARVPFPPYNDRPFDDGKCDRIRHMLFGTPQAVKSTIKHLHKLRYAEPNDWSRPISTGKAGEVMVILTKQVSEG